MGEKKNHSIKIIIGTILLVISMGFQLLAWYINDQGSYYVAQTIRLVSVFVFVIAVVILLLIYAQMSKERAAQRKENITIYGIAKSLSSDYDSVYYLNTDDDSYLEYGRKEGDKTGEALTILSAGDDFFADTVVNAEKMVYEPDRKKFLALFEKENLYTLFNEKRAVELDYRLVLDDGIYYYHLKVTQGSGPEDKYIVIGVRNNDKQKREEDKVKAAVEEGVTYGKIAQALASRYEVLYYVNTNTNEYEEYSSSKEYSRLDIGNHGQDFFEDCQKNMVRDIYSEDYKTLAAAMEKNTLLASVEEKRTFSIVYRLIIDGKPEYVNLRAVRPRDDNEHIIIGVININESMQKEEEYKERIDMVMNMANRDVLTGVKNKNAYSIMEKEINEQIKNEENLKFAVAMCDVNNLKIINDTKGHTAGDEYIREACMMICRVFKHSPVYRIGGDEFVVILKGEDFDHRRILLEQLKIEVEMNIEDGKVIVACGMADFMSGEDKSLSDVFEKADNEMYNNKKLLKYK